ncbi:hypothetical protein [Pedobacter chinensis]|nr:hypothetical protein [Pedobacter chinensis]
MKKEIIYGVTILACTFLTKCTVDGEYGLKTVTDSMSYKQILGTYAFSPNKYQAEKLNLKMTDSVMLNITSDSLNFTSIPEAKYYRGKFYLNRKISIPYPNTFNLKMGRWTFTSFKEYNNKYINNIQLEHLKTDSTLIGYKIQKDSDEILHIIGYEGNEIGFIVFDFKKIK